jgi:general secretion pathway protein M
MMERSVTWWNERSQRERILIGIMTTLFAVVVGWIAVLRPLDNGLAKARADNALAIVRLERVRSDAQSFKAGKPFAADTAQALVNRMASEAGFTPTRMDPGTDGRVVIGLASAKPVALTKWLQALDAQGVFVEQISLRPNSDATLAVDATLRARAK